MAPRRRRVVWAKSARQALDDVIGHLGKGKPPAVRSFGNPEGYHRVRSHEERGRYRACASHLEGGRTVTMHYPVIVERESNGTFSAWVAGLPGVYAAADTALAAKRAIRSAVIGAYREAGSLGRGPDAARPRFHASLRVGSTHSPRQPAIRGDGRPEGGASVALVIKRPIRPPTMRWLQRGAEVVAEGRPDVAGDDQLVLVRLERVHPTRSASRAARRVRSWPGATTPATTRAQSRSGK